MIIDSNNKSQRSILTNKCFYQTTARIMRDFEEKGYANSADETAKVIAAYHDLVKKKQKTTSMPTTTPLFRELTTQFRRWPTKSSTTATKKLRTMRIILLKSLTTSMRLSAGNM